MMPAADPGVMILAAGLAKRLRPLTDRRAKAVVPFLNRPLLDHTLDWLRRCGFQRVVINLHHAADSIVEAYGRRAFHMEVRYSHEPVLLGTAGGPRRALDLLERTTLLVNGDVIAMLGIGALMRHHREAAALATLGLYDGRAAAGYPRVRASRDGRLAAFPGGAAEAPGEGGANGDSAGRQKVPADGVAGVFSGVHLVERDALETLPVGVTCGIVDTLYRGLLDAGLPLAALPLAGTWYEVGDPGRYVDNQLDCLLRGAAPLAVLGHRRMVEAGYVSPHTHLETVRLRAPFLLGAGVRLRHGSRLQGLVAADRARVESGCRLQDVVLWKDAWVGPRCRLGRVVVMDGVEVAAGTEAEETVFTPDGPVRFGASAAGGGR